MAPRFFAPRLITPTQLAEGCFEAKRAFYAWSSIARRVFDNDNRFSWFSTTMTTVANLISRGEAYRKQGRRLGAEESMKLTLIKPTIGRREHSLYVRRRRNDP